MNDTKSRPPSTTSAGPRSVAAEQRLSPAMEDYLEAILLLSRDNNSSIGNGSGDDYRAATEEGCTVSEIAEALENARPSVSKAMKRLQEGGYVEHPPYGRVTLTEAGLKVATEQVRVHRILKHFLQDVLQLPEDVAEADTCRMEHAVSRATVDRLIQFVEQLDRQRPDLPALPESAHDEDTPRTWNSRV